MPTFPYPPLPAKNYQSPGTPVKSSFGASPNEGRQLIDFKIRWGSANDGGPNNVVALDMSNRGPLDFSIIQSLAVDNSACGADIQFVFPDTGDTIVVPAYTPWSVFPVFTNRTNFFVQSPNALDTDVTNFLVANYVMPPISIPVTQEQNSVAISKVDMTATSPYVLLPAQVGGVDNNGTLENAFLYLSMNGNSNNPSLTWSLEDGAANVLAAGFAQTYSVPINQIVLQLSKVNLRFQKGLQFVFSTTNAPSYCVMSTNLYYRTP